MQIVIVGANFGNKGAQSMLFTTVAALRRNYPNAKIFFAHANKKPCLNENFLFEEIYYHSTLFKISSNEISASTPPRFVVLDSKNFSDDKKRRFNH